VIRAAAYDGLFLIDAGRTELARAVEMIVQHRGSIDGFDIAVLSAAELPPAEAAALGATWAMLSIRPEMSLEDVRSLVEAGPPS
jgi:hypothetical protein